MKSALFFGKQIPVKECMEDKFLEEIEKLDFENDPESQRLYINNWVENTTHGEITDLLIPGSITKNTKLAIANAAYFKGTWQSKFKPEETKKEIFYVSNERQEFVDMMHVEGTFNHAAFESSAATSWSCPTPARTKRPAFRCSCSYPPPNPTH
ncbi:hypothetical protein pipiens_004407 [Culex pipiens pipiens]|uniref:Serpin domain-containing protein n=1 Tax=Culex pipiens pipiens TaxID=38569 RepID=A0ABD1CK14_CULPP